MFSLRNKKNYLQNLLQIKGGNEDNFTNYPHYPLLSGALTHGQYKGSIRNGKEHRLFRARELILSHTKLQTYDKYMRKDNFTWTISMPTIF